jgi:hypothetical protein
MLLWPKHREKRCVTFKTRIQVLGLKIETVQDAPAYDDMRNFIFVASSDRSKLLLISLFASLVSRTLLYHLTLHSKTTGRDGVAGG